MNAVQRKQKLETQVVKNIKLEYLLYLPKTYRASKERFPLILFLHGSGERGSDLENIKLHGLPKVLEAGLELPCIVVSPQCPGDSWWDTEALTVLLDQLEQTLRVDPDRICVTGLSMGGFGTWELAIRNPKRFAAIVPICGGGEPIFTREITHLPVWVFHGAKDDVVPLEYSQRMVKALKKYGSKRVKFKIYKHAKHDSWTKTYANPKLYAWMLEQKRV
jgi:predicted peptidase